jgi:hypothetical protein
MDLDGEIENRGSRTLMREGMLAECGPPCAIAEDCMSGIEGRHGNEELTPAIDAEVSPKICAAPRENTFRPPHVGFPTRFG